LYRIIRDLGSGIVWEWRLTISAKPGGVGAVFSAIDSNGRTIWIADAHRDNGKRFVVRADEKLTAFVELESAIHACGKFA
jgi:hypothetical protein